MNKIPVLGTLSRGYGFLIGDFVTIARLSWAPLLAATVVQFYFGAQTLDASIKALQSDDQSRMLSLGPMPFLLGVVVVVVNVMVFVALLRVVVSGDRKPGLWVYAWFGGAELRIIESSWGHIAGGPDREPRASSLIDAAIRALLGTE